jgi:hypothetical protein
VLGFDSQNISTPGSSEFSVVIELSGEVLDEQVEFGLVFFTDVSQSNNGGILLIDQTSESFLVFDDAVRDLLLAAKVGHPENQFDGVNIGSDDNQLGLLVFNQGGHVVKTEFENSRAGGIISLVGFNLFLGLGQESGFLLFLGFRRIFLQ